MAKFENKKLSVLNYANGFTMWSYKDTNCSIDEIMDTSFFVEVHQLIMVGDILMVTAQEGSFMLAVTEIKPNSVTINTMSKCLY